LLVVDDDPSVLDAVKLVLERAGYDVETTTDVFGLPLRLSKLGVQGILLDVDLPALTGDKLATNILKLRSARDLTIVFHSAEDEDRLRALVASTGVAGYIPKGLPRHEFLARVRALFGAGGERFK
jgi:DNA-binding response OmpR family regulator